MYSPFTSTEKCVLLVLLMVQIVTSDSNATQSPMDTLTTWPSTIDNKSAMALNTLRDMSEAFKVVMNDSNQISQLIPKMYNVTVANPAYVFKLPQGVNDETNYLAINKNDFVQPIFPNLTGDYVRLMSSKVVNIKNRQKHDDKREDVKHVKPVKGGIDLWKLVNSDSFDYDDNKVLLLNLQTERSFIEYVRELNRKDDGHGSRDKQKQSSDEWTLLGLFGWKGALSKPKKSYGSIFKTDSKPSKNSKLKWDLPGKVEDNHLDQDILQAMKNNSFLQTVANVSHTTFPITNMRDVHLDTDVYIGRVNDPFGHSTKWNFKNTSEYPPEDDRKKRAVIELYSMIKCSTGCDPIIYKGYGCYCGFLGNGRPVDGIDQCCRLHDKCYENSNCISYLEYFVPYIWKCYRGKPLCAIDHGEWGGPNSCAARLCQCDLTLSRCLRRFLCPQRRAICRSSRTRMLQNLLLNF